MRLADVLPDSDQRAAVIRAIEMLVKREIDSVLSCDPSQVVERRWVAKGAQKVLVGMQEAFSNGVESRKAARQHLGGTNARSKRR